MSGLGWFLVIYMIGSDELLVKQMASKEECIKTQQNFNKKVIKKIKTIEAVTCEEGTVFESYNVNKGDSDEIL